MPSVLTIDGPSLGYDDQGHLDELDELLDAAQHDLNAVADAHGCQAKFDAIVRAIGSYHDALAHGGAIEGAIDRTLDEQIADRFNRLGEHLMRIRSAFRQRCLTK